MRSLDDLRAIAADAAVRFTNLLQSATSAEGVTPKVYRRYLSMQHHLTRGVQRHFMAVAAHPDLVHMRRLRHFLFEFALEEERHYEVAANDLAALGQSPLPAPLDVELWHAYFAAVVAERPFLRLGAAAVLENLSNDGNRGFLHQLLKAPFLNADNTRFLVLHMHERLPHGAQIFAALEAEQLQPSHLDALCEGAAKAAVMYLRMARWALDDGSMEAHPETCLAASLRGRTTLELHGAVAPC